MKDEGRSEEMGQGRGNMRLQQAFKLQESFPLHLLKSGACPWTKSIRQPFRSGKPWSLGTYMVTND